SAHQANTQTPNHTGTHDPHTDKSRLPQRSEERRVGKECRQKWAADDNKRQKAIRRHPNRQTTKAEETHRTPQMRADRRRSRRVKVVSILWILFLVLVGKAYDGWGSYF